MSSEWPIWQIQDVCSVGDGAHSKVQRIGAGVPYLTSKNIGLGNLKLDKYDFISADSFNKLFPMESKATRRPKPGDLLIGIIGTFGNAYLYKESDSFGFSSSIGIIRPNKDKIVPRYLYYVVTSPKFKSVHIASDGGSAQGYTNIPAIKKLPIYVPPLQAQDAIASLLGALDDRIDLLRETNATLEAIAQALFKSWFVDFDPVHAKMEGRAPEGMDEATAALFPDGLEESELGLVPRGWLPVPVYDLGTYINGAAYKAFSPNLERRGLPIIKIAELKAGVSSQTAYSDVVMPEKYRINTADILFSWSGNPDTSIDTFVWSHGQAWLNQHIFRVLAQEVHERSFLLRTLKYLRPVFAELARNKQTTGLGHVTVADLKRLLVIKPDKVLLVHFDSVVSAIHDMMFNNDQAAQSLATLRDTLLPRLISGQLRIPEAAAQIDALAA